MKQLAMQVIAVIPVLLLHGAACYFALFIYLFVSVSVVTNTAKTRAIETRVSNLETMTYPNTGGTINGNQTITGTHTVGGNAQVNGYLRGNGGGTLENDTNIHTAGVLQADAQVTSPNIQSTGGSTNEFSSGIHSGGVVQADGGLTASNFSGPYQGGQSRPPFYPATVADGVPTHGILQALNDIVTCMIDAGVSS